jgi:pyrroline-5-carboxylate reductase
LGGGNMGSALIQGLLHARVYPRQDLVVADVDADRRRILKKQTGAHVTEHAADAIPGCDTLVLAVKPQQMTDVLSTVAQTAQGTPLVISVAAGITTATLEHALPGFPVVRVMPNTPALLRAGAMVYCLGKKVRPIHEARAKKILSALGPVWKVAETHMDAVTALSGSGPAYVFYLAEAMAAAGVALGLDPTLAEALARQTIFGAGKMLAETPTPAAELRRRVTSPGGTTQAALSVLERGRLIALFERALTAAQRRSKELSAPRRL